MAAEEDRGYRGDKELELYRGILTEGVASGAFALTGPLDDIAMNFVALEDAYGLYECVCFESKLPKIAPVVARASYFLVHGRLQNNHKRGLAIVAEEVFDLEGVLARRREEKRPVPQAVASTAGTLAIPKRVG